MEEADRVQALELLAEGLSSKDIAERLGVPKMAVAGVKAGLRKKGLAATGEMTDTASLEETEDAWETKLTLERDMQKGIRADIGELDPSLRIADEGKERFVDGGRGRIDILAEDDQGLVVIELKANEAPETAITQVLYYVGALARETSRPVRGVLVAHEFSDRVKFAAEAGRVRLVKYEHRFSFSEA